MKRDKLKIGNRTAESSLIQGGMGGDTCAGSLQNSRLDPADIDRAVNGKYNKAIEQPAVVLQGKRAGERKSTGWNFIG